MINQPSGLHFRADSEQVASLSKFGFTTLIDLDCEVGDTFEAVFLLDDQPIDVKFRVRSINDGKSSCTFVDLPIRTQEVLARYVDAQSRINVGNSELMNRSYDELAAGITSSAAEAAGMGEQTKAKTSVKSLAMLVILLVFAGLARRRNPGGKLCRR